MEGIMERRWRSICTVPMLSWGHAYIIRSWHLPYLISHVQLGTSCGCIYTLSRPKKPDVLGMVLIFTKPDVLDAPPSVDVFTPESVRLPTLITLVNRARCWKH